MFLEYLYLLLKETLSYTQDDDNGVHGKDGHDEGSSEEEIYQY